MMRIFIILMAIVFGLAAYSYGSIEIDKIVAIVNNETITLSELEKVVSMESQEALKGISEADRAGAEEKLRKDILNELIDRRLQLQRAKKLGIAVSAEDLKEAINDIKRKNSLNDAAFEKALAMENMTLKEYEERLREQLMIAKLFNQEVRTKVVVTDKDIASFYEDNKQNFLIIESVKVSHIFLKLPEKSGEKEMNELKETLDKVQKRLKGGEDFAEVARAYSNGPTAGSGGSLGILKKGEMAPELEEVAFLLKKGEISGPIWTRQGVHILRVEDRGEGRYKKLDEVTEEIRKTLSDRELEKIFREWITELRESSFVEVKY